MSEAVASLHDPGSYIKFTQEPDKRERLFKIY